jgi:hypothetical protein
MGLEDKPIRTPQIDAKYPAKRFFWAGNLFISAYLIISDMFKKGNSYP